MAPINKKTYSKSNNDSHLLPEKQNVDPFDELLSSPLKQEVKFKPLKFWTERANNSRSQGNFSKAKYGLFETSDSEDLNSPFKKKKKLKSKSLEVEKRNHSRTKHQNLNEKVNNSVLPCNSIAISGGDKTDISRTFDDSRNFSFKYVTFRRGFNLPVFDDKTNSLILDKTFKKEGCLFNPKIQDSENHNESSNPETKGRNQNVSSVNSNFIYLETCETLPDSNVWGYQSDQEPEHNENCRQFQSRGMFEETLLRLSNNPLGTTEISDQPSGTKWENSIFSSISSDRSCMSNDTTLQTLQSESLESVSSEYDTVLFQSALSSNSPTTDKGNESLYQVDIITQKTVQDLTRRMSDIRVTHPNPSTGKASENDSGLQDEPETTEVLQESSFKHVTRRRRPAPKKLTVSPDLNLETPQKPNKKMKQSDSEKDMPVEEPIQSSPLSMALKNRISNIEDRFSCLTAPVFESTRVMNDSQHELEKCENLTLDISMKIKEGSFENSFAFKSGKKWLRSMSVLRQIQNGSLSQFNFETTKVKGKNYKNFVQEIIDMQSDISSLSIPSITVLNKTSRATLVHSDTSKQTYTLRHPSIKKKDENLTLQPSRTNDSWFSSLTCNKSSLNHTVKVKEPENSFEKPSSFRRALGIEVKSFIEDTVVGEKKNESSISPRDFILAQCGQEDVLPFEEYFNERTLKKCKKIGEGVYGEVFMCNSDTVIKIIPIEGSDLVNGEPQKKFEEILSEVVIASKLTDLRKGEKYRTSGFSELKRCWCVAGKYPKYLLDLWNQYDQSGTGSENDSPVMFKSDQLYIILELANGGKDLEAFVFSTSDQSLSIFIQTAYSLAAAEKVFEFEHRDLHWGNLLIAPTKEKYMTVVLDGVEYKIPTKGVKVSIIDFTLSRIFHEGCCIFNDLSIDPSLFTSQGDYQFEIYRMMHKAVQNDWSSFEPKTNLFWLHYILDKMVKLVRYENKTSQMHKKSIKKLKVLEDIILEHEDSFDFVLSQSSLQNA